MVYAASLGYPRIGFKRELKTALERFWTGQITEPELLAVGAQLRLAAWQFQKEAGLDFIPSNDFSLYDHMLDTVAMVGAVPERFLWNGQSVDLYTYFLMARGAVKASSADGRTLEASAMEMTKWFNTNYHFIVPELKPDQQFKLSSSKCVDEFREAQAAGIHTRPVLVGPITFLQLAKGFDFEDHNQENDLILSRLLDVYAQVLAQLKAAGADWVQMDEPCLAVNLTDAAIAAFSVAYERLAQEKLSIMLTSYFSSMGCNLSFASKLPVQGIHLDLVNGSDDLLPALADFPEQMYLSAGVVDGHNVWRCDLDNTLELLELIADRLGPERLIVAPSCSLLHVPIDVDAETRIHSEVKSWLAFARQKIQEVSILTDALCCGRNEVEAALLSSAAAMQSAEFSEYRNNVSVKNRLATVTEEMAQRTSPFVVRSAAQQRLFNLPLLPTTTIGSFPQTREIREARKQLRSGQIDDAQYKEAMCAEIRHNVEFQERVGIDVFVHGEPERTDMVEYFAAMLEGVAISQHGWVQSYGSRCVKPPIIFGNVSRPEPMTVGWAKYAQSLTAKPVKGMLTGPVTMLQWSFIRDDQPREQTCLELALAIRDEVIDLESAGIKIIQIDEPAIREGLPLKRAQWEEYFAWAIKCFKLTASGVADDTQIHTHMCYSEFGDMVQSIADMDADVISIEAARSAMDLLDTLKHIEYPNAIGPGVYDIHSPRVPSEEEMIFLLQKALQVIPAERLWVNPDCGLKTRGWEETIPALESMVRAAAQMRQRLRQAKPASAAVRD